MSNPQHLHVALAALAPASRTFYDDEAKGTVTAPWIVGSLQMPSPISNLVGRKHGGTATWRVTVAGGTGGQARVVAAEAEAAWLGARISVPGYVTGSVRPPRVTGPYPAGLTATDTDLRFQVVVMEFDLTVSQTP